MIKLVRTDSTHPGFFFLVQLLDAELSAIDGSDHSFYDRYNSIDDLKHVVVAYANDQPVTCGAMKAFAPATMEIKRMYTLPGWRGQGMAHKVLFELETWAKESGIESCVLETGRRQPEAIRLYKHSGYHQIPNYDPYKGMENSLCFQKKINT